jgi:ribosome-associated toxin RatA of RatAB toxin-antitoxin module
MGLTRAERSTTVAAPAQACFDAITDYDTFPQWQTAVSAIEVRERDERGRGSLVTVHVDVKVRKVSYTLRYHYEEPTRVWWDFVEGEGVRAIEGSYTFEPDGDGTLATYRLGIDPGVRVPGPIGRMLTDQVMGRSIEELRKRVESSIA